MRILVVHNASAGDRVYDRESLVALISAHGHDVEYMTSDDDWAPALAGETDLVVAVGGDGTVADVARFCAGGCLPVGVLPLGTANNVACALGLVRTPVPAIVAGWTRAERWLFDMGRATGPGEDSRFFESVGVGLLAESIGAITEGGAGYVDELESAETRMKAAIGVLRATLRQIEPIHVDLVLDGRRFPGEYLMVEVLNFGYAGPNLRLAPDAVAADGLFDIVLAEARHRAQLIDDLPRYRSEGRLPAALPTYQAREVTLTCHGCRIHLDDRLRDWNGSLSLAVEPRAVTFLV